MPADEPRVSLDTLQIIHLFSHIPCFHFWTVENDEKMFGKRQLFSLDTALVLTPRPNACR